jgi:hypothetical protein
MNGQRKYRLAKLGLTPEVFARMLEQQGGRCAICNRAETSTSHSGLVKTLAVDHDHATGIVRGLLCEKCNHGLGRFTDDPEILVAAAEYLIRVRKTLELAIVRSEPLLQ